MADGDGGHRRLAQAPSRLAPLLAYGLQLGEKTISQKAENLKKKKERRKKM